MQGPLVTQITRIPLAAFLSAWLIGLSLIALGGCIHSGSPEQMQSSANYPQHNPAPTHNVTVEGTVSPTLRLQINAVYEGQVAAYCYKSRFFSGGEFGGTATPLRHTVPVILTVDGGHFHGQFFADQLVPGKCGWHLHTVVAVLSREKLPEMQVVIAQALDRAKYADSQYLDYSEEPTFVHVRYLGGVSGWQFVPKIHEKSSHGIDDATHHIETDIIDDSAQ
jgi:hypothetical protein